MDYCIWTTSNQLDPQILKMFIHHHLFSGKMITNMRIQEEMEDLMFTSDPNTKFIKANNNRQWIIEVICQKTSPFHSRSLKVQVDFPENYPIAQSTLKLLEPSETIFHPNISSSGTICHEIVKSSDPSLRVVDKVRGFVALLETPNAQSPYNSQAAKVYKKSPNDWYLQALMRFNGIKVKN